jgi:voltage-gated potassium channel Kch
VGVRTRFAGVVEAFQHGPVSVRNAIRLIVVATAFTTVVGGVLVRVFDHKDFRTLGDALWWALQTVTTVGYGDVTPKSAVGRVIGSAVLLYSVAFLTILTASITTSFIERARGQRQSEAGHKDPMIARLDEIASRLERLERILDRGGPGQP